METTPSVPEAPDAELVEFLGGEVPKAPPTAPEAPAQAAQPEAKDGAQPRDATGKFTTTETPAAPAEAVESTEPAEAPPEPVPPKPFSYRAYGADHPLPGAVETAEGKVEIPPDAVPKFRQVLAEGHQAESRRRTMEREHQTKLTSARQSNIALVRKSEIALQRLAELRRNPEALQNWFNDLDRNWAVYEAEVERDTLRQQLEDQQRSTQEQLLQQQAEALRPQMRSILEREVGQMIGSDPDLSHLNATEATERLWGAFFERVFQEAQQDDPGGRYRKGEILIDYDAIRAELQYEAKLRGAAKTAPTPQKPVAPPVAKPPVAPPPVVATKGAGARPAPKVPTFRTTKEVDDWFDSGGGNDF